MVTSTVRMPIPLERIATNEGTQMERYLAGKISAGVMRRCPNAQYLVLTFPTVRWDEKMKGRLAADFGKGLPT
jgi:hypothetical protein